MWLSLALSIGQGLAGNAQGPLREQPIRVPGTDVVLEEGWTLVYTERADARCMYAVPTAWAVSPHGWEATDPRGTARVEVSALDYGQWAAHRAAVQAAMPGAVVREDTPRRFRIERLEALRRWQHIAEADGTHVCAANIEARRTDRIDQLVQKIASTVHVAHEGNLNWMRKR